MTPTRSWCARAIAIVVVMLAVVLGVATPASATDSFDRFDATYQVAADGSVRVTETAVLRFGAGSGRHGYDRYLVTREAYDDHYDMVFAIDDIEVSSPDDVSVDVETTRTSTSPRDSTLRIRIGSASETITADTATYVIGYTVRGALRSPNQVPEFYGDVTGSSMGAVTRAEVRVTAPNGVDNAVCFAGPVRSATRCTSASIVAGEALFVEEALRSGELLTVSAQMPVGSVSDAVPTLVERGDAADLRNTRLLQGAGAASALGIPLLGWWYYRRNGHDQRYAGVPPGTVPVAGQPERVVRNDPRTEVPVAFSPPKLPLTHAGFLLDGAYRSAHLTATLVGLATAGAIQLSSQGGTTAILRLPQRAPDVPSRLLLAELFRSGDDTVDVGAAGQLAAASDKLAVDARAAALGGGWFKRIHRGRRSLSTFGLMWVLFVVASFTDIRELSGLAWFLIPATVALAITLAVVWRQMARGQRTALGRAWTDQVEGFRTYISTAEADQLRFEEGEDIFSKYLPWAVLFGVAERWVAVCEQAIATGQLARPDTTWYGGTFWDGRMIVWNIDTLGSSMGSATSPSVAASGPSFASDTGFGGGSAFGGGGVSGGGGGGFAGGGGGGGGGGSW